MIEARRYLTGKQKAELLLLYKGRCAECGAKFDAGNKPEYDHLQALALGGTNDISNFRPICGGKGACHSTKTKADVKAIAKGKRQQKKFGPDAAEQPKRFKVAIQSRGFDKTRRRTMAGKVVARTGPARMA